MATKLKIRFRIVKCYEGFGTQIDPDPSEIRKNAINIYKIMNIKLFESVDTVLS